MAKKDNQLPRRECNGTRLRLEDGTLWRDPLWLNRDEVVDTLRAIQRNAPDNEETKVVLRALQRTLNDYMDLLLTFDAKDAVKKLRMLRKAIRLPTED